MRYKTWGVLAHVDAGKTTFIESMLVNGGVIRTAGRVDKGNAFLDTDQMEKDRGITIFSKQALLDMGETMVTLMDTPGHVDFSAEMERTLKVLDCAILVVSGSDGIQSHTRTLWRLLSAYEIPVIIFVNKMDQPDIDREKLLAELKQGLSNDILSWGTFNSDALNQTTPNQASPNQASPNQATPNPPTPNPSTISSILSDESIMENVAMCDETAMENFLENGSIPEEMVSNLFYERKFFPVVFGSALMNVGVTNVEEFMRFVDNNTTYDQKNSIKCRKSESYSTKDEKIKSRFSGYVYKISHDSSGEKVTHIKITEGKLSVKDMLGEEKVHGIRIYNGAKYENIQQAEEGMICAITGPTELYAGMQVEITAAGEFSCKNVGSPYLAPVLSYRLILPEGCDVTQALRKLNLLAEEDPDIALEYEEETKQVNIKLMGEIQTEVITRRIKERFNLDVTFGESRIIYKETIKGKVVEGVGHFEPLRHYAEAHLLLEAGEPGSGIVVDRKCSEDVLDLNWQRLILTHVNERTHRGVLTGSPITDIKITLVTGKAHPKHTEGGDFRQATYRAIRNGLMQAESVLLEPYYDFVLRIPSNHVGRAMTDLERMHAADFLPETDGDYTVLRGKAPAACIQGYGSVLLSYTSGLGELGLTLSGYGPCHNSEEVIEERGYDPLRDIRNTGDSVFCEHGSGVIVPWDQVKERMHMPSALTPVKELTDEQIRQRAKRQVLSDSEPGFIGVEEVDAILNAATHANKKEGFVPHKGINHKKRLEAPKPVASDRPYEYKPTERKREFLLVDGYNVIFAWKELNELAQKNIDSARDKLLDILCNYQPVRDCEIIAVFDAYRVENHSETWMDYHNIHVVFTKTAETADRYIERFVRDEKKNYRSTVVTSDGMEQIIVRGAGAGLISSREFEMRVAEETRAFNSQYGVK